MFQTKTFHKEIQTKGRSGSRRQVGERLKQKKALHLKGF